MSHTTTIVEVTEAELDDLLEQRASDDTAARFPGVELPEDFVPRHTGESLKEGYVAAGFSGTAYAAACSCGWEANNPLPTQDAATRDAVAHEVLSNG